MKITHYEFGHIGVDGREYTTDVIISDDSVQDKWWRKEGHNLSIEDLARIVEVKPEAVIIGTGYYGYMRVPEATRAFLVDKGVMLEVMKTSEAVARFNELQKNCASIVAALHLTC